MSILDPRAPLLPHLSPYQVDFVIPRIGIDLPLGIDPFLLFKSRDSEYRQLHTLLIATFNAGVAAIREGDTDEARRLFDFPEVSAIGLGYTQGGKRGSGVGGYLAGLIIDTLAWIIHEVSSQKRKDALKGMMNTGFAHPASPFGASIA